MPVKKKLLDRPLMHFVLIALLGLLAYSNTFDVPFHFDDIPNIVENYLIRDLLNVPSLLAGRSGIFSSRPFMHATFAVNYHLGGLDTTGYHVVNVALHLLNGILLYFLVAMTGRYLGYDKKDVTAVAVLSSVVFTMHPVQTEAVTNIVNRSMLLADTFYLSGMMLFHRAVTAEKRRSLYITGLFVVSLLGMGSRENFSTFPIMLILYDMFFISRFRLKEATKHYKAYLPVFLSLGYMAHLVLNVTYAKRADIAGIPPVEYALTQLKVHWTYIRLLLVPLNQNLDYDYPVAETLFELPTVFAFVGYAALWTGSIIMARKRPLVSFLILWFLVTLLPVSFILALTDLKLDDVIFEHRLYLPGVGAIISAGILIFIAASELQKQWKLAHNLLVPLFLVLVVALSAGTYSRNSIWKDEISLWEDTVKKSPGKARPHNNLGIAYKKKGLMGLAVEQYERAIEADPVYANAYSNLGNVYLATGLLDKAIGYYETALSLDPNYADANYNMGVAYHHKGEIDEAIRYYAKALEINPDYADAHYNLGLACREKGDEEMARAQFKKVLRIEPTYWKAMEKLNELRDSLQSGDIE
jgi:tetratricopeptide (TPR) repeat protein